MNLRSRVAAAATAAGLLALAACGGGASAGDGGGEETQLSLVGFAVPEAANKAIAEKWAQTEEGAGVSWQTSYGASGDQSRAVEAGLEADYVHFSLEGDVTRLVDAGLVAEDWNAGENKGIVSRSTVVLVVRKGNPKSIQGWDDVVKPGVGIVTPNPGSSGSARWNILGAWGHVIANGGTEDEAKAFLTKFFENTVALPGSGRDATTAFTSGNGDVLISYENEAIRAQDAGEPVEYVVPEDTIQIDTLMAVTTEAANPEAAQAFLDYLYTPEAQQLWADSGYRPVDPEVLKENEDKFPTPPGLFTIEDFGGWETVATEFFDPENGLIAPIEEELGVPTG